MMDLHDYKDVAENYDNYLSVMFAEQDNFLNFYLDLAKEYGNSGVIDIACGTGAVLLHLAQNGIDIDGTDLSDEMVVVSKKKAKQMGLDLDIFPGNMTNIKSKRKYSLAIIARSGFMHLTTPDLQRQALLNIRDHLLPNGILTLNTFAPHPAIQAEQMETTPNDYTFRLEYTNINGNTEQIFNAITYDPYTQIMYGNWKFVTTDNTGKVIDERIRPLQMRQTYKQEMMYLIELCGFEIVNIYSDYFRNTTEKGNYLWVLRKTNN